MNGNRIQGALMLLLALVLGAMSGRALPVVAQAGGPPTDPQAPQANAANSFTYQGELKSAGTPLTGSCESR